MNLKATHMQFNFSVQVSIADYAKVLTAKERKAAGRVNAYNYDVPIIAKSQQEATKRIKAIYQDKANIKFLGMNDKYHDEEEKVYRKLDQYIHVDTSGNENKKKRNDAKRIAESMISIKKAKGK